MVSAVDRRLIYTASTLRSVAVGITGVILSLYLSTLGSKVWFIGIVVSLGLAGCALGTFLVTWGAERWGRRRTLVALSLLMALGGFVMAVTTQKMLLALAALIGMVNGMGQDRGAAMTIEHAILPRTGEASQRTAIFAWYNLLGDGGHALGALLGGLPALLRAAGIGALSSYRWTLLLYSLLSVVSAILYARLSAQVERPDHEAPRPLSARAKPIIAKFSALSALDSLGGGFLSSALVGYWFFRRFGIDEALLGPLFFGVRIANALSHLGAAWLARRIGLVNTMVWTHLPSSLMLLAIPFVPSLPVAVCLFILRECFVEMDVPTRQSYIVAVVEPHERLRAAGFVNLTRVSAWTVGPAVAGSLMGSVSLSAPLLVGPSLKIAYDLLLYRAFHRIKPPEEDVL